MDEEKFLQSTLEKIKKAVAEIENKLNLGNVQMDQMQDYFWENYTEFDEYGYEYSQAQANMEMEANSLLELKKDYRQYQRMLDTPYFGRFDFVFDGEEVEEAFYVGIRNFTPKSSYMPLIYDWRAPISSLFYDYDTGVASYKAPDGIITGEIRKKIQYKIRKGKMIYALETNLKIDDDILRTELSDHADATLKSIVTTIQKEQNRIIRNEEADILIVQGSAGSGKTSIALHRIAYLLYHHRESLKASQVLILSPNEIFADYISHILPELGEEKILETTFDMLAYKELKHIAEPETRYEYLENMLNSPEDDSQDRRAIYEAKNGQDFTNDIYTYVMMLEDDLMDLDVFRYGRISYHKQEMMKLFYEKFSRHPLLKRMDAIAEYIVDANDTLNDTGSLRAAADYSMFEDREGFEISGANESSQLAVSDPGYARKMLRNMYRTTNILDIYNEFLLKHDMEPLPNGLRKIPYEDVYPLLYLKYLLEGTGNNKSMKHLVIDEMQDYSYLQYTILRMVFNCPMTILGDKEQSMETDTKSLLEFLPKIFGKKSKVMVLDKSYRSTSEISSFASKIAGIDNYSCFDRKGEAIEAKAFKTEEEMIEAVVEKVLVQVSASTDEDGKDISTHAILCKTAKEAEVLSRHIDKYCEKVGKENIFVSLNEESEHFGKGVSIMPFYLAKGLEFDNVHVVYADSRNFPEDRFRSLLYIMSTRALHTLDFYCVGKLAEDIEKAL